MCRLLDEICLDPWTLQMVWAQRSKAVRVRSFPRRMLLFIVIFKPAAIPTYSSFAFVWVSRCNVHAIFSCATGRSQPNDIIESYLPLNYYYRYLQVVCLVLSKESVRPCGSYTHRHFLSFKNTPCRKFCHIASPVPHHRSLLLLIIYYSAE